MLKLGILISGEGSNLQAIINACESDRIPGKVVVVISNNPDAHGLERAKKHNIPVFAIDHRSYSDRNTYELEIVKVLQQHEVELVCLAGYMRIVGEVLLQRYRGKMINIHPSLLPSFPGLHAQRQALEHGVLITGCTVHYVDEGCDTGPIIIQSAVPIMEKDDENTLAERILAQEHAIYPEAIRLIAEDKLKIEGRIVKLK
ncbi:phosphoribosylglycinamide formyltransferase [candidate division WOR-1 bacterium RIFOXYA12_FULL_52_29]|uniref:Phosphoribosylglycinamide formyltransferase n=1 Tax=candidate division WOR-1 bacterium RIFOXYC12_FULL_54_18 TaxID=1802584 RepID=A0A1F4T4M3_UNCSA|nr:MAG: phosphoribosylglycinamide formyltransferase [candidate division WOR-1 bacterium RIFOXYA2_FULL_51_19]OGC17022.1 MAG: phosphoribosylglycinamide formyltransferase [candidate division WOR-1 bacterium RIFOXYA12_FULL_52_29]OGC25883.1 MAG: phosphoribosylglycinamide formyltransferase [candidate division WOR-1 bacterium RIFOXYB2_FULL_45_9]OGC27439.1 MAG: phosphoribosylglycinamide formyltransferase [candidate division WOR-1 bacterium RIFOXYC12_FULL_54_18]OGC29348.1 MAG: phosphoribosylglycinamide 